MARQLRTAPITAEDLSEYLSTQDSFALELRVLQYATGLGYAASHGGSYVDPSTSKHRQFDLRATLHKDGNAIALAMECKSLQPYYPLLVSRIPRTLNECYQWLANQRQIGSSTFPIVEQCSSERTIYQFGEMVGKSLAQVGKAAGSGEWSDSSDETYDKWSQALQSSVDLFQIGLHQARGLTYTAVVPCLVVTDGTLWAVDYDPAGALVNPPTQVDEATLFVGRTFRVNATHPVDVGISHLHIYTETGMRARLHQLHAESDWWERLFP